VTHLIGEEVLAGHRNHRSPLGKTPTRGVWVYTHFNPMGHPCQGNPRGCDAHHSPHALNTLAGSMRLMRWMGR
jgi:hypothetical protein